MDDEAQSGKAGSSPRVKAAILVALALAVGLTMAVTGRNSKQCGCPSCGSAPAALPRSERIVAYYFHPNERSSSCASVEASTREAIEAGFPEQLNDGRLEWRVVNYEEAGNEHFLTDYKLAAPSVVLVRMRGNTSVEWRSLPEVWKLADDRPALARLVQRNVQEFLDYVAIPGACCN